MNTVMKKIRQARSELVLLAVANIVLGVIMVIKPEDVMEIVCRAIGIVLTIWGIIHIINYFRVAVVEAFGSFGLVQGVALIAFGVYVAVSPRVMAEVFTVLTAILVLIGGVTKVQYAVDLKRMNSSNWWIELVVAIMLIILGAIALFDPFSTTSALMFFIGIALVLGGVADLVSIIRISVTAKRLSKDIKEAFQNGSGDIIEGEIIKRND